MTYGLVYQCRSCKAQIVWLPTKAGKNIPVNLTNYSPEDKEFKPNWHVAHFATCPHAKAWRKRKNKREEATRKNRQQQNDEEKNQRGG
jgi:hypothetical protein